MAGQPSAPEDHAATLLPAEPRSHDTVFMVRVQRRFRSWGAHGEEPAKAGVSNHAGRTHPAAEPPHGRLKNSTQFGFLPVA
jgi:hypothetical protein